MHSLVSFAPSLVVREQQLASTRATLDKARDGMACGILKGDKCSGEKESVDGYHGKVRLPVKHPYC